MIRPDPRRLLLFCAVLDLLGLLALLILISLFKQPALQTQVPWVFFTAMSYLGLGWLFGSYTLLRWRSLPAVAVLQRVLITGLVTVIVVALARLLLNPADSVWLVHRSTQVIWLSLLMLWSVMWRVLLRRGVLIQPLPRMFLVGSPTDMEIVLAAWKRTPPRQSLRCISLENAVQIEPPVVLAVLPPNDQTQDQRSLMEQLLARDPRETSLVTPLQLLERQLERLPPRLVPDPWIDYQDLPWNRLFSLERQLKRVADLLVSVVLLALTAPLLLLSDVFDLAGGSRSSLLPAEKWLAGALF